MAIPDWTWGDVSTADAPTQRSSPPSVDPLAETFATLSHPHRLEILFALVRADGPLDYSSLRASTSVEDKGQFNYHLRQPVAGSSPTVTTATRRLQPAGRPSGRC